MATVTKPTEQRLLLHNVSWQSYENLLKEFEGRHLRMTYDRGNLEIMTLSHGHENYGVLLGRFVETLTLELDIDIHSGGSTTFKREAEQRGLEADECYWIKHEPLMRGKKEFDPTEDPPPDLALEIDISRSSISRMPIYASLRVPEVWRFDGTSLFVYRLRPNGKYELCARSLAFPYLPLDELVQFLRDSDTMGETSLMRSFIVWVRERVLPAFHQAQAAQQARQTRRRDKRK